MPDTVKRCSGCGINKPLDQFHKAANRADGVNGRCKECHAWDHKLRRYGVTREAYEEMYDKLDGVCPLCQTFYPMLCIDHDHETDEVRGLLCIGCNRTLGYVENEEWLVRALDYLDLDAL